MTVELVCSLIIGSLFPLVIKLLEEKFLTVSVVVGKPVLLNLCLTVVETKAGKFVLLHSSVVLTVLSTTSSDKTNMLVICPIAIP